MLHLWFGLSSTEGVWYAYCDNSCLHHSKNWSLTCCHDNIRKIAWRRWMTTPKDWITWINGVETYVHKYTRRGNINILAYKAFLYYFQNILNYSADLDYVAKIPLNTTHTYRPNKNSHIYLNTFLLSCFILFYPILLIFFNLWDIQNARHKLLDNNRDQSKSHLIFPTISREMVILCRNYLVFYHTRVPKQKTRQGPGIVVFVHKIRDIYTVVRDFLSLSLVKYIIHSLFILSKKLIILFFNIFTIKGITKGRSDRY